MLFDLFTPMSSPSQSAAELLTTPVQFLRGVGPQRAELLQRLGLHTSRDLLFDFPRDYQDLTDMRSIATLEEDKFLSVQGVIDEFELRNAGVGRSILGVLVRQGQHYLRAMWFNQSYMRERFVVGQEVLLSGKAMLRGGRWEMHHPRVQWIEPSDEPASQAPWLPIYGLTEGLSQGQLRSIIRGVLETCAGAVDDVLPPEFLVEQQLPPIQQALEQIHFPPDRPGMEAARRRFIFQELLVLQLALALKRQQQRHTPAAVLEASARIDARIRRLFAFEFTAGQNQAIAEMAADMARPVPMNRLLQGDVGSGKTVVALYAMLLAVAHGYQAALMAPTEVLARQHARTLGKVLAASQVRSTLLTGGLTARERQAAFAAVASGEAQVVIGTQAILADELKFARLGLVVIDEQHKFGVRQRASLKQAAASPHYLVMTATPIPRTLTMTLFGDLDVSTIRDNPPGRQPVHTYWAKPDQRAKWWEFFRRKLREGQQGYVIAPLVDESEQIAAASLKQVYESLANGELEAFRLAMIHGQMSAAEKTSVMDAFHAGTIQVLVATSVVEVGVDVPNATLMAIEDGQRFGLAQLHQLRGRITRGIHPGFCCVFAEAGNDEAAQRLTAFVESNDGFKLSETDAQLRGPGDLLGTRQHGLPPLRIADIFRDAAVLEEARRAAQAMIAADPDLRGAQFAKLRRMVFVRYGAALDLGDVG